MADAIGAVEHSDPTDPTKQDKPTLTNEERLELNLLETQKKLLQTQAQAEASRLEKSVAELVAKVQGRLKIDLNRYRVDLDTGVCTPESDKPA